MVFFSQFFNVTLIKCANYCNFFFFFFERRNDVFFWHSFSWIEHVIGVCDSIQTLFSILVCLLCNYVMNTRKKDVSIRRKYVAWLYNFFSSISCDITFFLFPLFYLPACYQNKNHESRKKKKNLCEEICFPHISKKSNRHGEKSSNCHLINTS